MNRVRIIFIIIIICGFNIYSQPYIIVTHYNDLTFGEIFMGYSGDVQHTDPNAAKFSLSPSSGRRDILVQFTLPAFLTFNQYSVPIYFDLTRAAWSKEDLAYGRTNFNPSSPLTLNRVHTSETVYIWLGGVVNVPAGIYAGLYQGTIILTAEIF